MTTFTVSKIKPADHKLTSTHKEGLEELREYCTGENVTLKGGKQSITVVANLENDIANIKDIIINYGLRHTVA